MGVGGVDAAFNYCRVESVPGRTEKRMGGGDDPGRSVMCRVSL